MCLIRVYVRPSARLSLSVRVFVCVFVCRSSSTSSHSMSLSEQMLPSDAVLLASNCSAADQLPFYKRPRPNAYRFERDDFENIPVVQHRFKPRPPYVPPTQVSDGGQAQQAGIQLGDAIVRIGDQDTDGMSLAEAQQRIDGAAGELKLAVKSDAEDGAETTAQDVSLGRRPQAVLSADRGKWRNYWCLNIVLKYCVHVNNQHVFSNLFSAPRPLAPQSHTDTDGWISQPERKVWHPVMWQQPPPPVRADRPGEVRPNKKKKPTPTM